jgi:two-component system sensor histidine kinase KdpD
LTRQPTSLVCWPGEAAEKARLDTGARLNLEPRSIEEIIDAARKDRRALFGTHSIQVQVPLELPAVRADLELIKKAPTQLLENASKYSPAEEPITVSVEVNGDFVMTSVIDRAVTVAARSEEGWGLAFNALQHFLTTHVGLSNTTIVE